MRATTFFISTLKEAPADAEVVSHRLMVRAGMIKKLAAGIYSYLPVGLRAIRKIETAGKVGPAHGTKYKKGHAGSCPLLIDQ